MDAVTAHLHPEPPALSLPPRVPLSCPQPRSGYPHSQRDPGWAPGCPCSHSSCLHFPVGVCLAHQVCPGSTDGTWAHVALGPTHPCTCQPAPAPDQPVLSLSIAQVTERQWICSAIYFHFFFPLFFCSHGWCAFYDFREVFLCSRKCKFLA